MPKCNHGNLKSVKIGDFDLDPCVYEEIERYKNVTVIISRCKFCGNYDISWARQEDTEICKEDV